MLLGVPRWWGSFPALKSVLKDGVAIQLRPIRIFAIESEQ